MQYSILGVSNIMFKYRGIFQGHLSLPFGVAYTTGKKKKGRWEREKKRERTKIIDKILKRLQRGKNNGERMHSYEQESAYMEEVLTKYFLDSILAKSK